jgi:hypothetical protein
VNRQQRVLWYEPREKRTKGKRMNQLSIKSVDAELVMKYDRA